jgi:cell division cycle 14
VYEPFFADFGPLNMACAYRFCQRALAALEEAGAARPARRVYFCTTDDPHRKTNAAVLVGCLCVMHLGRTADEAYRPLLPLKPFAPFRDASCGPSTYHLTVLDCLRGLQRARDAKLLDFRSPAGAGGGFDGDAYEHYERVEHGDLNWAVPGKLIAFSGPHARRAAWAGYASLTPEDYWTCFRSFGISAVIRLNKRLYDRRRFTEGGFRHHELFFPDGACPTQAIVDRFCALVEAEPGCVAVHCKAGLGRTGVLIGLYIMKHYGFSANETLGYLRIVRPGSVIGPQQHFLRDWERRMWAAGEAYRAGAGPRLARLSAPRVSHGAGGAYDDGDISDEDAHAGSDEDDYDDGGYTCGVAPPQPAQPAAAGGAARSAPTQPPKAPLPAALRTSPTKPLHSGTRPSALPPGGGSAAYAASSARGGGVPPRANSLLQPRGAGGSASGDEGTSGAALRRGGSLRGTGYISEGGSAYAAAPPARSAGLHRSGSMGVAATDAPLRKSGQGLPSSPLRSSGGSLAARAPAAGGVAERLGSLRRSLNATMPAGGSSPQAPADNAALMRTISALSLGGSPTAGAAAGPGASPPVAGAAGVARIVTASGQPRKLPAAALAAGAYADAYSAAALAPGGAAEAARSGGSPAAPAAAGGTSPPRRVPGMA